MKVFTLVIFQGELDCENMICQGIVFCIIGFEVGYPEGNATDWVETG